MHVRMSGLTSAGKLPSPVCAGTKVFSCSGVRGGNWEKASSGKSPTAGLLGVGGETTLEGIGV